MTATWCWAADGLTANNMSAHDHYHLGVDLFAEGKLEEAVAAYHKALDEDPHFTDAMHGIAQACLRLERFDDAIAMCKRITEVDRDDVLAHTAMSQAYQSKGMIKEAEAAAGQARIIGWRLQYRELQKKKS